MSVKNKRGLGRGLDALFEDKKEVNLKDNLLTSLPIELIKPNPLQPRKNFSKEALNELAASIKDRGILQPIIVRPLKNKENEWQIIAGERRWKAAQLAGLHEVPVSVKDIKDEDVAIIALIENIQRENLSPIEEALGYKRLMNKFSITQEELGIKMSRSRAYVTNFIRLLSLPEEVQKLLAENLISVGQVRPIIGNKNSIKLAHIIVKDKLSARQVEQLVKGKEESTKTKRNIVDVNIRKLEQELEEIIGLKTVIRDKRGKGQIIFNYKNLDQLDQLIKINSQKRIKQIIVRWEIQDLCLGVSDLELYEYCLTNKITLKRNTRIHLKAFWNNKSSVMFGSANVTKRGLGEGFKYNFELNGQQEYCSNDDRIYFQQIILKRYNCYFNMSVFLKET